MLFALVPKGKKDYLQVADEDSRIQKQIENAILVLNLICWNEWLKLRKWRQQVAPEKSHDCRAWAWTNT